ncbi:hypothetical protein PG996_008224 [Apiospora saccharicola]|uniref:Uncharacterized protein n=1 Tax=Apiospora saccharicola TaxID=335842 RepID=A0ABR1UXA8_9PEZI
MQGTWGGGLRTSRSTVVTELLELVARDGLKVVPKYALITPPEGRSYWERRTDSSTAHELVRRIEEAEVGALEARLLGLPAGIVAAECRQPGCRHCYLP